MTVIKRGQIAILSITLMLAIAGYINYKYDPNREKNLGQTVYVNGKDSFTYDNVSIYSDPNKNSNNTDTNKTDTNPTTEVNSNLENMQPDESTIAVFRYDRDNMFSELSENYRDIINNASTTTDKINEYQNKLNELISKKNLITMVENVIKAKGIKDIVIIPTNNDNLNVVVKSEIELKPEQVAQIQQILMDQFGIKADKISIATSKE